MHANLLCIVVLHGNDGLVLMHRILSVVNSVIFCFVLMVLMLVNGLETNDVVSGCEWCVNVVNLLFLWKILRIHNFLIV